MARRSKRALTDRQEKALAALMLAPTVRVAAEKSGVAESTLRGWLADPKFAAAYAALRDEMLEQAAAMLSSALAGAVVELTHVLRDAERPGDRLRAAEAILDGLLKVRQLHDLARRVAALEEKAGGDT